MSVNSKFGRHGVWVAFASTELRGFAIIRAVQEARQRSLVVVGVLSVFCLAGCQAGSSVEAAQTAVAVLPAAQATAQTALASLQGLLGNATVDINITPTGAANDAVTDVTVAATDAQDRLVDLDTRARQAAATAALMLAGQYYPNASISLTVVDRGGNRLVRGTKAPGQLPEVQ